MNSDDLPPAAQEPQPRSQEPAGNTQPDGSEVGDAHVGAAGSPSGDLSATAADRWRSPRGRNKAPQGEPPILTLTLIPEPVAARAAAPARGRFDAMRRQVAAIAAAVLIGVCGGFAVQLLTKANGPARAVAVASESGPAAPPKPDPDLQMAQMTAQIRVLSASLADVKGKLAALRTSADGMSASLEAARADIDHNRQTDDIKALKRSVDGLKQGLDQAKADWTAAAAQASQKPDRTDRDPATKLSQIADRLDRQDHEQAAKLAQLGDRLDKLERRPLVSPDITRSIAKPAKPATPRSSTPPAPAAAAAQLLPKPQAVVPPLVPVLPGMQVLAVESGSAYIESRDGGVFELTQGDWIPGIGKIESIERRGGEWVVVTNRGVIGSGHR
jgi:hypothetical protein